MNRTWLVILLLAALLSGCTGRPAPDAVPEAAPPPAEPQAAPQATLVVDLARFEVMANAAEPAAYVVAIPEGARNVSVRGDYLLGTFVGLRIAIDGCGEAMHAVVVAGVVGSFEAVPACEVPTPGEQGVTVFVDGQYLGHVTVQAEVPAEEGAVHGDIPGAIHLRRPLPIDPRA